MTEVELVLDDLAARDITDMATKVARWHQVTLIEMLGHDRHQGPSWARQALWAELYSLGHWSYPRLGALFRRDSTTIRYGIREHLRRTGKAA